MINLFIVFLVLSAAEDGLVMISNVSLSLVFPIMYSMVVEKVRIDSIIVM